MFSGSSRARLSRPRATVLAARQAGRSGLVAARRLSGAPGMLPGLLIVGAQRGGTTSMVRALAAHPALVSAARFQEVHYFDTGYQRGQDWYRSHFPRPRPRVRPGLPGPAARPEPRSRWRSSAARTTCSTRWRRPGSAATCRG